MNFKINRNSASLKIVNKLWDFMKPDKEYLLQINSVHEKRSLPQLKYYWAVIVTLISGQTGYTANEVHQELGKMFLSYEKNGKNFIKSTGEMSKLEIEKYYEQCRLWAWHELQIHIPLPNEISEDVLTQLSNIYDY